jgi:nitrile hydratase
VDGIADMGGKPGYGTMAPPAVAEPVFKEQWQARAFALALLSMRTAGTNLDSFRHALDRQPEPRYLGDGYYGRWLHAAETMLVESSIIAPDAVEKRVRKNRGEDVAEPAVPEHHKPDYAPTGPGSLRVVDDPPAFAVGDRVRARNVSPPRHTRLVGYVRGHEGVINRIQPSALLPDTHATFEGENPQHVYSVAFDSHELWGEDAEPFTLNIDLWESYLEAAQ